jgi:gliding motility-associated-like protein
MNFYFPDKIIRVLLFLMPGLFYVCTTVKAQLTIEWDRTYGGQGWEELQAMSLTDDGGYIYGGITTTRNASSEISQNSRDTVVWPKKEGDFWVIKTDGNGNPVWDKRYGGYAEDRLWCIRQTNDGGFILGGESTSGVGGNKSDPSRGGMDFWVVKTDANGNIEWDATYGGPDNDTLRTIIPMPDGSYVLAGYSNSRSGFEKSVDSRAGTSDYWVVKIASDGTYMKDFTLGGAGEDRLFDAALLPDGNVLLAGYSTSPESFDKQQPFYGINDYWVLKINLDGNVLWEKTFGGSGEDVIQSVYITQSGSILLIGQSSSPVSGNKTQPSYGNQDAWLINIEDQGSTATVLWEKTFGGLSADYAYSAAQNSLGYFMILGVTASEPLPAGGRRAPFIGFNDFWVLFLDNAGNLLWDETLGGVNYDSGVKISRAHEYGFILGGHSSSTVSPPYKSEPSRGVNDLWIVRTGCAFPGPDLQDIPKACQDESLTVNATVDSCEHCIYVWHDGSNDPIRTFAPSVPTEVKVTIVHPDGCDLSDSLLINIIPGPKALITDSSPVSCFGAADAEFLVEKIQGGTAPFLYSLNGGAWEEYAHYTRMPPGEYTLNILDANECPFDTSFTIIQPEEVIIELGEDIRIPFGDSVQLQALTNLVESFTFFWGQPDQLSCNCLEPWVRPFYSTTYSIHIKNENGCEAKDLVRVIVERDTAVFIPTAFSPNNDNINDFFTVYTGPGVERVKTLMVFDRWGEKMFERHDFPPNVDQLGWDGRLDGRPLQPAVFTYWAEIVFIDGKTGLFEGGITLLR